MFLRTCLLKGILAGQGGALTDRATFYRQNKPMETVETSTQIIQSVLGQYFALSSTEYLKQRYLQLGNPSNDDQGDVVELAACAGNIVQERGPFLRYVLRLHLVSVGY